MAVILGQYFPIKLSFNQIKLQCSKNVSLTYINAISISLIFRITLFSLSLRPDDIKLRKLRIIKQKRYCEWLVNYTDPHIDLRSYYTFL